MAQLSLHSPVGDLTVSAHQYKPVPEAATRLNMLLSGEADLVGGLNPPDFARLETNANLRVSKAPGSRRAHIGIPVNNPKYKQQFAQLTGS